MSAAIAINFGSQGSSRSKQRTADTRNVAAWIKLSTQNYEIDDSGIEIMVTELECNDPDCVPLETLVALLGKEARWTYKILKPLAEVTQENVNNVPFPPSWSSWVAEQTFKKKHAEVFSWMCSVVDDFDQRVKDLDNQDQLQAVAIMERLLVEFRDRAVNVDQDITVIQDESSNELVSVNSNTGIQSNLKSTNTSNSTIVTMKPKIFIESSVVVPSIGSNNGNQIQQVISNEKTPLQTQVSLISAPESGSTELSKSAAVSSTETNSEFKEDKKASMKSTVPSTNTNEHKKVESQNMQMLSASASAVPAKRHKKGTRPRGCPCCDPDSIDNIIDKMIFLETPP